MIRMGPKFSWTDECIRSATERQPNLSNEEEFKNIIFLNSDVDDGFELAKKFNVKSIPSLLFFKKGKMIKHHVGFINKEELKIILKSLL